VKKLIASSIVAMLTAVAGIAQNPCGRSSRPTDQERFVQREIQERIDESIEAAEANDLAAKTHYFAPNLTLRLVDGTVLDRALLEAGMKRDSDWTLSVSDQTTTTIECLN
jgi:hypothetical protein